MQFIRDLAKYAKSTPTGFKSAHALASRVTESTRIVTKYPHRVPVIIEQTTNSLNHFRIKHKKYLVPTDLSVGQFMYVLRERVKLNPENALFAFIGGAIPATSALMSVVYKEHADADGFLYFMLDTEQTYG